MMLLTKKIAGKSLHIFNFLERNYIFYVLDQYRKYEKSVQAISDFIANCLTSIPKSMGSIIIKSLKAHYDKRCNNAEFAAQFIEHNKCFENAAIFEKFHLCSDRWYHQMQALKGLNQDTPTAIRSSCCILHVRTFVK